MVHLSGQMETDTMDNLRITKSKDTEYKGGKMEQYTMESGKRILKMVMAIRLILMGQSISVSGKMARCGKRNLLTNMIN